ncbi:MAG: FG-GAP repeat protein [Anaerolineales bacterium]|nr:FG-GAP repeat protein [Anaerolineales bacterium]
MNSGGNDRGALYIFERDAGGVGNWGQVKKLGAFDGVDLDNYGRTVALDVDTLLVSAPRKMVVSKANGVVYLYERNQGGPDNWGYVKKLLDPDMAAYNEFGYGLAISGDTVVVGSAFEAGAGTNRGAAHIFERNQGGPDNWGNVITLSASNPQDYAYFGGHADIDGDTVIIGAYFEDIVGTDSGAAYIFERNWGGPDNWGLVQKLIASDADQSDWFGSPVSIQGDNVVVGAYLEDGYGINFGAAYVFGRDHGGADHWGQVQKLGAMQPENNDFFGASTAISGDTIVTGAYGEDSSRGAVYVYYQMQGLSLYLPLLSR